MDKILIDIREVKGMDKIFKGKDYVSLDDILDKLDDLNYELYELQNKFDEYKEYIKDNFKQVSVAEQVDVYDDDFI